MPGSRARHSRAGQLPIDDRFDAAPERRELAGLASHRVLLGIAEPLDGVEGAFILGLATAGRGHVVPEAPLGGEGGAKARQRRVFPVGPGGGLSGALDGGVQRRRPSRHVLNETAVAEPGHESPPGQGSKRTCRVTCTALAVATPTVSAQKERSR